MKKLYLFFAVLCAVLGTQVANAAIYFNAGAWDDDGVEMSAYFYGSGSAWTKITNNKNSDGYYIVEVPSGSWTHVIFTRGASGCSQDWDNGSFYNQTSDLQFTDGALYTFNGFDNDGNNKKESNITINTSYSGGSTDTPIVVPTKGKWKVSASSSAPAVFLVGNYLNNWRPTPEYQLENKGNGVYELKNFVIYPDTQFKIRVFTGTTSYTEYSNSADGTYWINTWKTGEFIITGLATNQANYEWKLGQTMIASLKFDYNNKTLSIDIDETKPSTHGSATIKGVPFVSLVGSKFTQAENYTTPNSNRNVHGKDVGNRNTNTGWQEGFVQYDAKGNILTYDSGVNESAYGSGVAEGRALYNTIWPPKNEISFVNGDWEFVLSEMTFKYVGVKKRSEAGTNNSDANSDTQDYAVYEIPYVWMDGVYKIWTGWGGQMDGDYQGSYCDDALAEWRSHYNWGYLGWDNGNSTEVNTDTFYPMNGKQGNAAGGDFNFDERHYFSKVELWYNLSDPHGTQKSYFIAYLANGDPIVSIARTGKTKVTGTYRVNIPETEDRGIESWSVTLYKENGDKDIAIKTISGGATTAEAFRNDQTIDVDGLDSGIYYFFMTVNYPASGDVAAETLTGESTRVRIFGEVRPTNVTVKQLAYTDANAGTLAPESAETKYWSFDLAINASAPTDLIGETDADGNNILNLVESYTVTIPKLASGEALFTAVEGGATYTEDANNYIFDVAPNKDNDYAMPTITLRNVIPGDYTVNVSMVASDGDEAEWEEIYESDATASVEMVVPDAYFIASQYAINPVNETSTEIDEAHLPMGVTDNQPVEFQKANKISTTDGKITPLMVTNDVLLNWSVDYTVKMVDVRNSNKVYTYALNGVRGKAINKAISANFDYLPIGYNEVSAGLASENATIAAIQSRIANGGTFNAKTSVSYKRAVSGYTTDVVATTDEYPTGGTFSTEFMTNGEALSVYEIDDTKAFFNYQIEDSYNWLDNSVDHFANYFASVVWTPNTTLNNAAGYYAASTSKGSLTGYTVVKAGGGYETKAFPAEGGEITYGTGYASNPEYQLAGYVPGDASNNFAEAAAAAGKLPVKVWNVGDGKGVPTGDLDVALIAYYPVIIKPTLTASIDDLTAVSAKATSTPVFVATGVEEEMITLSYPDIWENTSGATTDIVDIVTDGAADFRIYPNPVVDVVNVAASTELGTIEIYSVDGRLVKKIEADDTHAAVEVGDLVKGSYIIRAAGATQHMIKK